MGFSDPSPARRLASAAHSRASDIRTDYKNLSKKGLEKPRESPKTTHKKCGRPE
jgi:hypothetical protein